MLVIDRENPTQRFVVTATQYGLSGSTIEILSDYSKVSHSYNLPANTSDWQGRYDEYVFNTDIFSGLTNGLFSYTIKSGDVAIEVGMLKVVDKLESQDQRTGEIYQSVQDSSSDDDFLIYSA